MTPAFLKHTLYEGQLDLKQLEQVSHQSRYWMVQTGPQRVPFSSSIIGDWRVKTKHPLAGMFSPQGVLQTIHVDIRLSLPKCNS